MKYARYFLLCLLIVSCNTEEPLVLTEDEDQEEEVIDDGEEDEGDGDEGDGDDVDDKSDSGFPLTLPLDPDLFHDQIPNAIHPAENGGVYLVGKHSGMSLTNNALTNWTWGSERNFDWTHDERCTYDRDSQQVLAYSIFGSAITIYQINAQGAARVLYEFSNDHDIDRSAKVLLMDGAIYFYWKIGDPGYEQIVSIVSLDLEGELNWKKEFDFEDFIYPDIVARNGLLFVQYGNYIQWGRTDDITIAAISSSGDLVNEFSLTSNLAEWNKAEPLVKIQVDDNYIYTNTTKNDFGLFRKSRIAKYTYSGELVSEVEIPYSKDFYVGSNNIYASGNDYGIDPDLRTGYAFVAQLDTDMNMLNIKKFDEVITAVARVTVSNDIVYFTAVTSSEGYYNCDQVYVDALTFD